MAEGIPEGFSAVSPDRTAITPRPGSVPNIPLGFKEVQPGESSGGPEGLLPSRTGIIPEDVRGSVRQFVEEDISEFIEGTGFLGSGVIGEAVEFGVEISPAMIGTSMGMAIGSLFGGVGIIPGGMLGGFVGELIGQETGVTEQSDVGLAASALGPLAGKAIGTAARIAEKPLAAVVKKLPPAQAALGRIFSTSALDDFSTLGGKIIAKQIGNMSRPASEIYDAVRKMGVVVNPANSKTISKIKELEEKLVGIAEFSEVREALNLVKHVRKTLEGGAISFGQIIGANQQLGLVIKKVRAGGNSTPDIKFAAKSLFKAMRQDIDDLAKFAKGERGEAARLVQAATERAKLEFSVVDFQTAIAKHTKWIPKQEEALLDVNGLRQTIGNMTNKFHPDFNENFTVALGKFLPAIKKDLFELGKITERLSPGGPGSLVIRGIGSRILGGVFGAAVGFGASGGNTAAGAVGSMIGASLPEITTAIFLSKPGRSFLRRAVEGGGVLNQKALGLLGQIIAQASKPALPGDDTLRSTMEELGLVTRQATRPGARGAQTATPPARQLPQPPIR